LDRPFCNLQEEEEEEDDELQEVVALLPLDPI
jgi:hypothetical protein